MRIQNTQNVTRKLAEFGLTLPEAFDLPNDLFAVKLAEANAQQTHVDENERWLIAVGRAAAEHFPLEQNFAGTPPEPVDERTPNRFMLDAYWKGMQALSRTVEAKLGAATESVKDAAWALKNTLADLSGTISAADHTARIAAEEGRDRAKERMTFMRTFSNRLLIVLWLIAALLAALLGTAIVAKAEPKPKPVNLFSRPLSMAERYPELFSAQVDTTGPFIEVQDEGTRVKLWAAGIAKLNCVGAGITCTFASGVASLTVAGGGSASWSSLTAPTAAVSMVSDALAETATFDFQSAFTTGSQFLVKSSTGNPTGGVVFEAQSHDVDVIALKAGDGTGYTRVMKDGSLEVNVGAEAAGSVDFCELTASGTDCLGFIVPNAIATADAGRYQLPALPVSAGFLRAGARAGNLSVLTTASASGVGGCTNQFARTLNDAAAPTCATVAKADAVSTFVHTDQANSYTGGGLQDLSANKLALPAAITLPGTCTANKEIFVDTDVTPAGQQVYLCNSAGTGWNLIGDGGAGGTNHNLLSTTHTDTLAAAVVLGDIPHGNATPAWARLAGNITTTKQFLSQTGTGAVSAAPAWGTIVDGDVPAAIARDAEINVQGTASEITSSGSGVAPVLSLDTTVAQTDVAKTWTATQDFSGAGALIVVRGTAVPSASTCDVAAEVASLYVQSGDPATVTPNVWRCSQTGASAFAWILIGNGEFNAKAYGAVGNGTTDDTAALQALANSIPASGATVFVPAGHYKVTSTINWPNSTRIVCEGNVAWGFDSSLPSVTFETAAAIVIFRTGTLNTASVRHSGIEIENCSFRDTGSGTALGGVLIANTNRSPISRAGFWNFSRAVIPVPTITGGNVSQAAGGALGSRTEYAKITCVHDAGGETQASNEISFAVSANFLLTISGVSATVCPAPSSGWRPYVAASSGTQTWQLTTNNCTLNSAGTGCALNSTWTEPVGGLTTNKPVVPDYNYSGGFAVMTLGVGQADAQSLDASYASFYDLRIRNACHAVNNMGGRNNITEGQFDFSCTGILTYPEGQSQPKIVGVALEASGTASPMVGIGSPISAVIVGNKFEGPSTPPNSTTCIDVRRFKHAILGNTFTKCNMLVNIAGGTGNLVDVSARYESGTTIVSDSGALTLILDSQGVTKIPSLNIPGTNTFAEQIVSTKSTGTPPLSVVSTTEVANLRAATATALAANPADCAANQFAISIVASGNLTCASVSLTADVSGILPGANGGTNNGFMDFTGPASTLKTFTLPNASATILTSNAAVTIAQGGTGTGSTLTGLVRGSASAMTAAELSGAVATSGSNVTALATKYLTWMKDVTIDVPTTADTNKVQWYFGQAVTITRVACSVGAATSVTIQLDERAEATPNTAGVDVMTAALVCTTTSGTTASFTNATIAARVPLNMQITSVVGSPGAVRVHIEFTID